MDDIKRSKLSAVMHMSSKRPEDVRRKLSDLLDAIRSYQNVFLRDVSALMKAMANGTGRWD